MTEGTFPPAVEGNDTHACKKNARHHTCLMSQTVLSPTNDRIFKLLFGDERKSSTLIDLLKSFVRLPEEEYELV